MNPFLSIESAILELQNGKMVILVDDDTREQEGDLIIPAENISPAIINFMLTFARGMICLTITDKIVERLNLPRMPVRNKQPNQADFTVSIEAIRDVTTGISTFDRTKTILTAVNPEATPADISFPGHVFPLVARKNGVLERPGHTEGSVDLVRLAGFQPTAVICEIMRSDGNMARMPDLIAFANQHQIKLVAINDLIAYRLAQQ